MIAGFTTLFFNISGGEIFIILLIVFLVFGPSKIPEMARTLGRIMNEVKKASSDISREFRKETTAMERDFKKTAGNITNDFKPLTEDPFKEPLGKAPDPEGSEIPDVYTSNDKSEPEEEKPQNNEGENSEKPIQ